MFCQYIYLWMYVVPAAYLYRWSADLVRLHREPDQPLLVQVAPQRPPARDLIVTSSWRPTDACHTQRDGVMPWTAGGWAAVSGASC